MSKKAGNAGRNAGSGRKASGKTIRTGIKKKITKRNPQRIQNTGNGRGTGKTKIRRGIKSALNWLSSHRLLVLVAIVVLLLLMFAFGARLFLYIKLIVGYDTIVALEADKTGIYLSRGEIETLRFKTTATTNPFCKASAHTALLT